MKKKVVKKNVDVTNTTVNKTVTYYYPQQNTSHYCSDHNCSRPASGKNTYTDYQVSYHPYNSNPNPCGGYSCYRDQSGRVIIINENYNNNTNESSNNSDNSTVSETPYYYPDDYWN